MVTRDVLKVFQIALAYVQNFQNITRAHKSRNALAFTRFPILVRSGIWTTKNRSALRTRVGFHT